MAAPSTLLPSSHRTSDLLLANVLALLSGTLLAVLKLLISLIHPFVTLLPHLRDCLLDKPPALLAQLAAAGTLLQVEL